MGLPLKSRGQSPRLEFRLQAVAANPRTGPRKRGTPNLYPARFGGQCQDAPVAHALVISVVGLVIIHP
jgi:hypothetical protein